MAKKTQKRQPEPKRPEARTTMRKDVRAALEDKTLSRQEGKQLAADHGMKAAQKLAKKLSSSRYALEEKAGKALGLKYREGRNMVTFDPRAFGKSQTYYRNTGLGSFGGAGFVDEQTRWKYPQNAPGKGWYVKGYKKGKDGSQVPIYAYGGPGAGSGGAGGKGKGGKGGKGGGRHGGGHESSWMDGVRESLDPLENQIWQQAQDSMSQIDYFDKVLNDMLAGMGDLSGTGPGFGYTVGVTGSDGAQNTYYTDPLGRPLPKASTLSVPLS